MEATSKRVTNKNQHKHNENNSKNNHPKNESKNKNSKANKSNNKNNKGKSNKHKNKSKDNNNHDHLNNNNRKTCHPAQQQKAPKPKDEKENGTDATHRRASPDEEWDSVKAGNMIKRGKSVAAYVCGFLNTGKGGNIWYGVHDSKTIHGIKLSSTELDKLKLKLWSVLRELWPPLSGDSEVIDIWHELIAPSTDKYYLLQVEVKPGVRLGQTTWLNRIVWQKKANSLEALQPVEIVQRLHKE